MSKIYSIKCPNCASPLSLLGGGRVQSVTCDYCKSLIDLNDNYKVLSNFKNVVAPKVPFKIGMSGEIEGREWMIIGWIVYRSEDEFDDVWSEFLLFSPFYGYGWLIYESGVISFSKRVRDFDLRKWDRGDESQTVFYRRGHYLLDDKSYNSVIDFVQGELTWIANKGDLIRCWDYLGIKWQSLTVEQSRDELEVYYTQRLDAKMVYESFGVEEEKQILKKKSFSEKLDEEVEEKKPLSFYGLIVIFIILLGMMVSSLTSDRVLYETINSDFNREFSVNTSSFLNQITITATASSVLNAYHIEIYQKSTKLFSIDKTKVYFSKHVLGKTWSSTAIGANIYLKLGEGSYTLKVTKLDKQIPEAIFIKIESRIVRSSYIYPLFISLILFFIYFKFRKVKVSYLIGFALVGMGLIFDIPFLFPIGVIMLMWLFFMKQERV